MLDDVINLTKPPGPPGKSPSILIRPPVSCVLQILAATFSQQLFGENSCCRQPSRLPKGRSSPCWLQCISLVMVAASNRKRLLWHRKAQRLSRASRIGQQDLQPLSTRVYQGPPASSPIPAAAALRWIHWDDWPPSFGAVAARSADDRRQLAAKVPARGLRLPYNSPFLDCALHNVIHRRRGLLMSWTITTPGNVLKASGFPNRSKTGQRKGLGSWIISFAGLCASPL